MDDDPGYRPGDSLPGDDDGPGSVALAVLAATVVVVLICCVLVCCTGTGLPPI